jgi:hypothetical protein
MLRYLPLIVKSAGRNRRRTLLTLASVTVSLCLMAMYRSLFWGGNTAPGEALRLNVTPLVVALCIVSAAMIGLASALVPGMGAARTSIVESLRHSG